HERRWRHRVWSGHGHAPGSRRYHHRRLARRGRPGRGDSARSGSRDLVWWTSIRARSRHDPRALPLSLHLTLLVIYSIGVVGLGVWSARYVRTSSAFFVAGRSLGPGLIFASMLAANIGAGATV